jgi:hypothetical protein
MFLLSSIQVKAQNSLKKFKVNSEKEQTNESYYGLQLIKNSEQKYHFRFLNDSQILDLFSDDGKVFIGQLVNYTTQLKKGRDGYEKYHKDIYEKYLLDSVKSSKIGRLFLEKNLINIPTDSLIKNWAIFLDCGGIDFEIKISTKHQNLSYSCLLSQEDSLPYVKVLKSLYYQTDSVLGLEKKHNEFIGKLKSGKSYSYGCCEVMYKLTKRESRKWHKAKPQREYLKSISDTLLNYLETELNKLLPNANELDCYNEYHLSFSKKGKFKKMKVDMSFFEKLADKDYQKCKPVLKKILRKIKIDFIDLKYKFKVKMDIGNDEVNVYRIE